MSTARTLLALCIMAAVCDAKLRFLSSKPQAAAAVFRRSYSSGSATTSGSATASASGAASGTASSTASNTTTPATPAPTAPAPTPTVPTPAPTAAATEAGGVQISQTVTMSSPLASVADFAGSSYKTMLNFGYGHSLNIVTTTTSGTAYKTGCGVDSTAAAARRNNGVSLAVTFTATVSAAEASQAQTASSALTAASLQTAVATVLTNLKASDNATYGSLSAPIASNLQSAVVTSTGGSGSTNAVFSAVALLGAAAMALKQ